MVSQYTIKFHIASHLDAVYTPPSDGPGAAFHTISIVAAFPIYLM